MADFHEYDVVRVTQLILPDRYYDGTQGVKRSPHAGDLGTIVHIPPGTNSWCIVESVNKDGLTVWVAGFFSFSSERTS